MSQITKKRLREALGAGRENEIREHEIAEFFGISASAVSQWPEESPIPELRQLQAVTKRPDLFATPASPAPGGA